MVAEVLALRSGRPGGFLRERSGPINDLPHAAEATEAEAAEAQAPAMVRSTASGSP